MPKLRSNQKCPLPGHGFICACRDASRKARTEGTCWNKKGSKWETVRPGVRRLKDDHADHEDGYRYKLSPSAMRQLLDQKIREQNGLCSIGGEPLTDYNDVVADHKQPRGLGGARRDDRSENIGTACARHNLEKGSRRQ